jgi:hypothetical protein
MVSKDGFAKILDFGLAKRMPLEGGAPASGTTMTATTETGFVVGRQWELPGAVGAQWELPGACGTSNRRHSVSFSVRPRHFDSGP